MRPQLGKEKILDTAIRLFAANGYHRTSTSDIATAAKVSKGLMYNYFKSKDEMLLAIVEQANQSMFTIADTMTPHVSYVKTLRKFLDTYAHNLKTNKEYLSFQLSLLLQPDLKAIVSAPLRSRADHLLHVTLMMFKNTGAREPEMRARRFISELDGIALHYLAVFNDYPLDDMLDQLFDHYKELPQ